MDKLYRVKALEWRKVGGYIEVRTTVGFASIGPCDGRFLLHLENCVGKNYKTLEAAKQRAWEWYLSRLLPALEEAKA